MKGKMWVVFKWLLVLALIGAGIGLMVYPFIANYLFENRQDSIISGYEKVLTDEIDYSKMFEEARKYNKTLASGHIQLHDPFSEDNPELSSKEYYSLLKVNDTDIMGYIDIPVIDVSLPIYHGTSEEVLEKGVGHLEGTSVPVGGDSVHTVLTGHTGLSNAKLFTDLTEVEVDDIFILNILNEKIAYKVYDIKVVEPYEISDLSIEDGKDLCTLVTCTPYGVNSHRLLVRGARTEYTPEVEKVSKSELASRPESQWMYQYKLSLIVSVSLIVVALIIAFIIRRVRDRKRGNK